MGREKNDTSSSQQSNFTSCALRYRGCGYLWSYRHTPNFVNTHNFKNPRNHSAHQYFGNMGFPHSGWQTSVLAWWWVIMQKQQQIQMPQQGGRVHGLIKCWCCKVWGTHSAQQWWWTLTSSGTCCCVTRQVVPHILKGCSAVIFTVRQSKRILDFKLSPCSVCCMFSSG
jgi:hypothetical protein